MKALFFLLAAAVFFVGLAEEKKPKGLPVTIDTKSCTYNEGCNACIVVCKTKAIKEVKVDGKIVLVVDPELCDGDGACFDVCPPGSVIKPKPVKGAKVDKKGAK